MAGFPGTGWSAWMMDGNAELALPVVLTAEKLSALNGLPDATMGEAAAMTWLTGTC